VSKQPSPHEYNATCITRHLFEDMVKAARAFKAYRDLPDNVDCREEWEAVERANEEVYGALRALRLNVAREVFGDTDEAEQVVGLLP
jgi:hypothetical protein